MTAVAREAARVPALPGADDTPPGAGARAATLAVALAVTAVALAVARSEPLYAPAGSSTALEALGLAAGVALAAAAVLAPAPSRISRRLLAGAGLVWVVAAWGGPAAGTAVVATAALLATGLAVPLAADGALRTRAGHRPGGPISMTLAALLAAGLGAGAGAALLSRPVDEGCADCARNLLAVASDPPLADAVERGAAWATVVAGMALLAALAARVLAATGPERRRAAPTDAAVAMLVTTAGVAAAHRLFAGETVADATTQALWLAQAVGLAGVGGAVTWQEHVRRRRREALAAVTARVAGAPAPGGLRASLAEALGDPSLSLAYPLPDGDTLVDQGGGAVQLAAGAEREHTLMTLEGRRLAVLDHRAGLLEDPELVEALARAGGLAFEHARLGAELAARLREVRASRARVVAAGDAERRRLERDLHDGAQQRLAALALTLQLVPGAEQEIATAQAHLRAALETLRTLAHGIFPRALAGEGLGAALEELAEDAARPVRVRHAADRAPELVETTAYLVAAAAVASGTGTATLATAGGAERLALTFTGAAAAPPPELAERVDALGGTVVQWADELRLELPCAW